MEYVSFAMDGVGLSFDSTRSLSLSCVRFSQVKGVLFWIGLVSLQVGVRRSYWFKGVAYRQRVTLLLV